MKLSLASNCCEVDFIYSILITVSLVGHRDDCTPLTHHCQPSQNTGFSPSTRRIPKIVQLFNRPFSREGLARSKTICAKSVSTNLIIANPLPLYAHTSERIGSEWLFLNMHACSTRLGLWINNLLFVFKWDFLRLLKHILRAILHFLLVVLIVTA